MPLPRRAGFVSSITSDHGEAGEANGLPNATEQAMGRANPSKTGSILMMVTAADFHPEFPNFLIKLNFPLV